MPLDLVKIGFISLSGIINIFLGFLVLFRNPRGIINRVFFLTGFLYGVWAFCLLFYEFPFFSNSVFWIKATYLVISFQQVFVLAFSLIFPKTIFKKAWTFVALYSVFFLGLTTYLLWFTNTWIIDVRIESGKGLQTILGSSYIWWSLAIWVAVIWASVNFICNMRRSKGKERMQILYLLFGYGLFGVFATLADIIFPLLYRDTRLFSISTTSGLIFTFLATYVIVKHRFLDIRLVVTRSIAYFLLIIILGVFYSTGLFLASTFFVGEGTNTTDLVVSTVLALFIAFTFQPLKRELEKITDAVFYKGNYDSERLLANIGTIMSTNIELQPLTTNIIKILTEQMRISKGAFIILGEGFASIYDVINVGFEGGLSLSFQQVSEFFPYHETLLFDDLEENHIKSILRQLDVSLIKTLKVKNDTVGILLLGEKESGEIYSDQDLQVLEILAPEMAVAIQNSQGYDKIKKFNVVLSQEVKKATADLQNANNSLKVVDKLKDDFVSIASHELRTPMTAIRSYAWMALHRSDVPLSKNLEKYIARILISTERLINLVNDMLNLSRIESGKIEINPEPVDLLSLVKDIIDEVYYSKSEEKKIHFIVMEKQTPKAFADPEKLRQVFLNLVGNSMKFTPDGGKIIFDFFTDGRTVEISVTDTGVGISKEDMIKLFHKFSRLDNSYTAAATSGGTGLGLYISKNLIELMHGKIWAKSEGSGKGSVFTVSLPVASADVLKHAEEYTIRPIGEVKQLEPAAI